MIRNGRFLIVAVSLVIAAILVFAISFQKHTETALSTSRSETQTSNSDPQSLFEAAKKEGVVNIWATNAEDLNWIPSSFAKAYPGIKVEVYTDLSVASRVIMEARGGLNNVDLVWNSEGLIRPLIERNLLVSDEWSKLGVKNDDIGADGYMAITNSMASAVAYRTDLVASANVPGTWAELTNVKYRGTLAASPFLLARLTAGLGAFESKEPWLDFARKIHAGSQTLWSNDLLEQTIVSGERPYVIAIPYYLAERWKARGVPVDVVLPEPVFITTFGSVVMRNAPHPNAARLLAVWLASPDGRAAREKELLAIDLRPSSDHPKAVELRASGKRLYLDTKDTGEVRNGLIPEFDRIFSGLK